MHPPAAALLLFALSTWAACAAEPEAGARLRPARLLMTLEEGGDVLQVKATPEGPADGPPRVVVERTIPLWQGALGARQLLNAPRGGEQGWILPGSLLTAALGDDPQRRRPLVLRWSLPDAWEPAITLLPLGESLTTVGTLAASHVALGDVTRLSLMEQGARIELWSASALEADLRPLLSLAEEAAAWAARTLGPAVARRVILFDRVAAGFAAETRADTLILLSSTPPTREATEAEGLAVIRFVLGTFLPTERMRASLLPWATPMAAGTLAGLDPGELEQLLRPVLLSASGDALHMLCLSGTLDRAKLDLFELVRLAKTRVPPGNRPKDEDLAAEIAAALPAARPAAEAWLAAEPAPPREECLPALGWRLVAVTYLSAPEEKLWNEWLGVAAWSSERFEVLGVHPGATLRPRDVLRRVGDTPLLAPGDLSWALRPEGGAGRATTVSLEVFRDGDLQRLELPPPAGLDVPLERTELMRAP